MIRKISFKRIKKAISRYIVVSILLISCNTNYTTKHNTDEAMRLSGEAADLIGKAISIEQTDSLKASLYYRQSLNKFLAAQKTDTLHIQFCMYLPDLYNKLQMPDSALYWKNKITSAGITTTEKN